MTAELTSTVTLQTVPWQVAVQSVTAMRERFMLNLVAASTYFLLIHFVVSGTRLRDALVARLGAGPYRGAFSIASLLGIAWMIYAYRHAPAVPPPPESSPGRH